jgi:hypothetical protein
VDLARGVAIVMVVLYHLIYDLDNFGGYGIESTSGFWGVFADVSAFVFVFLVGLSLSISYERAGAAVPGRSLFSKGRARLRTEGTTLTLVLRLGVGTLPDALRSDRLRVTALLKATAGRPKNGQGLGRRRHTGVPLLQTDVGP